MFGLLILDFLMLGSLLLAAQGFGRGQLSLGDVVAINALLLQLSRPMDFIGYTVSEVRQSLADMDAMARLLLLPDTPTAVRPSVGPADAPRSDVNSRPLAYVAHACAHGHACACVTLSLTQTQ